MQLPAAWRCCGGKIFISKLPSTEIETLADAVAPYVPRSTVSIRPSEKTT
jgi:hypothetical protein